MGSYEEFASMDGLLRVSEDKVILKRDRLEKIRSYIFNRTGQGFSLSFDEIDKVRVYRWFTHIVFEFNTEDKTHKIRFLEKSESNIINDGEEEISELTNVLEENTELEKNLDKGGNPIINYFREPLDL
jgi:hypothetical protein